MKIPYKTVMIGGEAFRVPDFRRMFGGSGIAMFIILIVLWLASGIYIVGPDEAGVIRTFGEYSRIQSPGLNYHLPWPIEQVNTPKVTEIKRMEIGYRSFGPRHDRVRDIPEESLMLTGSLNIIDIDLIVQYKISDPVQYLFHVRDVPMTIRVATEAVIRQVVGQHTIDEALTTGKGMIQSETMALMQEILDNYECGVQLIQVQLKDVLPPEQVADAFREVASAKEDKERLINEAQGYANNLIPKARGEGEQLKLQAQAFAAERVTRSEGEAARFTSILKQYKAAPRVTRKRMLLETMEEVLPGLSKYIMKAGKDGELINVVGAAGMGASKATKQGGGK